MKKLNIQIPIFNVDLKVLIGSKCAIAQYIQDATASITEIACPDTGAECISNNFNQTDEFLYITLYDEYDIKTTSFNIIHESLHAAFKVCKYRGITPDEEILCYLQGFILEKLFKCLNVELTEVTNHLPTQEGEQ